jgi:hypothetical protein
VKVDNDQAANGNFMHKGTVLEKLYEDYNMLNMVKLATSLVTIDCLLELMNGNWKL